MKNFIKNFAADESGASAAEYALILVIIGIAIVLGAFALGDSIGSAMSNAASCIANPGTSATNISAACK